MSPFWKIKSICHAALLMFAVLSSLACIGGLLYVIGSQISRLASDWPQFQDQLHKSQNDIMDWIYSSLYVLDDNGFEAITIVETDNLFGLVKLCDPALVLLDFGLKGISGGEWCAKLKSTPEFAGVPVIIFTAYIFNGMHKGSFGCDDIVTKPFDIYDLINRITELTESDSATNKLL